MNKRSGRAELIRNHFLGSLFCESGFFYVRLFFFFFFFSEGDTSVAIILICIEFREVW